MKIAIFSTDTKHHTYFINKLNDKFDISVILYEKRRLKKEYPTGPFFDEEQNSFEEKFFSGKLEGTPSGLPDALKAKIKEVYSVNQNGMAGLLMADKPDVAVTFGVGLVKFNIFSIPRFGTINIHRGIIQEYRGLDSDLWAIYNKRFDQIGVTIHYVDEGLDTGKILNQQYIKLRPEDEIYHLRYITTVVATNLTIAILEEMRKYGKKNYGINQKKKAPYYSAMPLQKKFEALKNFQEYKNSLNHEK